MAVEHETKLAAGAEFVLPRLDGVVDGISAQPSGSRTLQATYYDTSDLRLARWGVTVRYRTGDGDG